MNGMTIGEKIIAHHCGKSFVAPGEFVMVDLDFVMGEDITTPIGLDVFEVLGKNRVFDPERVAIVCDHLCPTRDIKSATNRKRMEEFAKKMGLKYFLACDKPGGGVEHILLPQEGLVLPGDIVIGADSHTCTYGALANVATGVGSTDFAVGMALGKIWLKVPETIQVVLRGKPGPWISGKDIILHLIGTIGVSGALYATLEYSGEGISFLGMHDRFTICNMAIECGAKNAIFPFDNITKTYEENRAKRKYEVFFADPDAIYSKRIEIDLSSLQPVAALPSLPENVVVIEDMKERPKIDQVFIGSCTNGSLEDLHIAAKVLEGKKIHKDVRLLVSPASQAIYSEAMRDGTLESIINSGGVILNATCGPCFGGNLGILAPGEVCISTSNRNFVGRMGHKDGKIILASPAVAAASALMGVLSSPQETTIKDAGK